MSGVREHCGELTNRNRRGATQRAWPFSGALGRSRIALADRHVRRPRETEVVEGALEALFEGDVLGPVRLGIEVVEVVGARRVEVAVGDQVVLAGGEVDDGDPGARFVRKDTVLTVCVREADRELKQI